MNIFLLACLVQVTYIHIYFYNIGLYEEIKQAKFYELPFREAVMNFEYEPLHPTYLSLWYCFAIALLLKRLKRIQSYKSALMTLFKLIFIGGLISIILLLSSRIGIIILIVLITYYLFRLTNKKVKWFIIILFFISVVFSFKNISYISSRFITEFEQTKLQPPIGKKHNSVNIRVGIYQCSMQIIKKNFLFGVGVGDVQDNLNTCYNNFDTDAYKLTTYNSHNYFFLLTFSGWYYWIFSVIYNVYYIFKNSDKA